MTRALQYPGTIWIIVILFVGLCELCYWKVQRCGLLGTASELFVKSRTAPLSVKFTCAFNSSAPCDRKMHNFIQLIAGRAFVWAIVILQIHLDWPAARGVI